MAVSTSKELVVIPSGYLMNASHHGLTLEAAAAVAGLTTLAVTSDVATLAEVLKAKGVDESLATYTAEFACALLMMADAHECPPEPPEPSNFEEVFDSMFGSRRHGARRGRTRPAPTEPKVPLDERMPSYVRRATVDCALSAGWACIATLATVQPVRWRVICFALADAFGLKMNELDRMTLQSLHQARGCVGA